MSLNPISFLRGSPAPSTTELYQTLDRIPDVFNNATRVLEGYSHLKWTMTDRRVEWKQGEDRVTELFFPSVDFTEAPDVSKELVALEEALPSALYQVLGSEIEECLGTACSRLKDILLAIAKHGNPESANKTEEELLQPIFEEMQKMEHFKPIKNFAGNVGADVTINLKVLNAKTRSYSSNYFVLNLLLTLIYTAKDLAMYLLGFNEYVINPRVQSFALINAWCNYLHPKLKGLSEEQLNDLLKSLELSWQPTFDALKGPYFDYSNETKMRTRIDSRKMDPLPSIETLSQSNSYCTYPLTPAEKEYATTKVQEEDISQPPYWGSADAKLAPAKDSPNPASQAMDGLPQVCSLSGVASDTADLCHGLLGLNEDRKFNQMLPFAYLALNLGLLDKNGTIPDAQPRKNHSAMETLFGLSHRMEEPNVCSSLWYVTLLDKLENPSKQTTILNLLRDGIRQRLNDPKAKLPHEILKEYREEKETEEKTEVV